MKIGYSTELLKIGIKHYETVNFTKNPHMVIIANSGAGKSYLLRLLIGRMSTMGAKVYLCDFKNSGDFGELDASKHNYWGYTNVEQGFSEFEQIVLNRMENTDKSRDIRFLVFDEYITFLSSLDKKASDEFKKRMAKLLFVSRSLNCYIVKICQRCLAENFAFGSRDMLTNQIFLGTCSDESYGSFVEREYIQKMRAAKCGRGSGFLVREGQNPVAVTIPSIQKNQKLLTDIERAVRKF